MAHLPMEPGVGLNHHATTSRRPPRRPPALTLVHANYPMSNHRSPINTRPSPEQVSKNWSNVPLAFSSYAESDMNTTTVTLSRTSTMDSVVGTTYDRSHNTAQGSTRRLSCDSRQSAKSTALTCRSESKLAAAADDIQWDQEDSPTASRSKRSLRWKSTFGNRKGKGNKKNDYAFDISEPMPAVPDARTVPKTNGHHASSSITSVPARSSSAMDAPFAPTHAKSPSTLEGTSSTSTEGMSIQNRREGPGYRPSFQTLKLDLPEDVCRLSSLAMGSFDEPTEDLDPTIDPLAKLKGYRPRQGPMPPPATERVSQSLPATPDATVRSSLFTRPNRSASETRRISMNPGVVAVRESARALQAALLQSIDDDVEEEEPQQQRSYDGITESNKSIDSQSTFASSSLPFPPTPSTATVSTAISTVVSEAPSHIHTIAVVESTPLTNGTVPSTAKGPALLLRDDPVSTLLSTYTIMQGLTEGLSQTVDDTTVEGMAVTIAQTFRSVNKEPAPVNDHTTSAETSYFSISDGEEGRVSLSSPSPELVLPTAHVNAAILGSLALPYGDARFSRSSETVATLESATSATTLEDLDQEAVIHSVQRIDIVKGTPVRVADTLVQEVADVTVGPTEVIVVQKTVAEGLTPRVSIPVLPSSTITQPEKVAEVSNHERVQIDRRGGLSVRIQLEQTNKEQGGGVDETTSITLSDGEVEAIARSWLDAQRKPLSTDPTSETVDATNKTSSQTKRWPSVKRLLEQRRLDDLVLEQRQREILADEMGEARARRARLRQGLQGKLSTTSSEGTADGRSTLGLPQPRPFRLSPQPASPKRSTAPSLSGSETSCSSTVSAYRLVPLTQLRPSTRPSTQPRPSRSPKSAARDSIELGGSPKKDVQRLRRRRMTILQPVLPPTILDPQENGLLPL